MSSIGVFDSGYGGLNILQSLIRLMPQYDYVYLGDNARSPYGNRSFEVVYQFTLNSVKQLFQKECNLIILACNTASAKALRTIQQVDLPPLKDNNKRVLGIIRPTTEIIQKYTHTNHVGILATKGTVDSQSYLIEIKKFYPHIQVYQQDAPMLVPLIENNEWQTEGAVYFIKKYVNNLLQKSPHIDTILLACTHYPIIQSIMQQVTPPHIKIISQGEIVAQSLQAYLKKHIEIEKQLSKNGQLSFYTSENPQIFDKLSSIFFNQKINSINLNY